MQPEIADSAVDYDYMPAPWGQSYPCRLRNSDPCRFRAASTFAPANREPSFGQRVSRASPTAGAEFTWRTPSTCVRQMAGRGRAGAGVGTEIREGL